jgi:hypothetical protein
MKLEREKKEEERENRKLFAFWREIVQKKRKREVHRSCLS